MSEETGVESDVLVSDSIVSLSLAKYRTLVQTVKSQEIKLKASRNLHQVILSKDHELKASQEKVQNLQTALDKAEMRLASQIRLAASGSACPSVSDEDSVSCQAGNVLSASGSHIASGVKPLAMTAEDSSSSSSSDLEADCAGPVEVPTKCKMGMFPEYPGILTSRCSSEDISKSKTVVSTSSCADCHTEDSIALQSRGPLMSQSLGKLESLMSVDPTEKASLSSGHGLSSLKTPGISKDLLGKLMQQNVRLKKVIRDILSQRGTCVNEYLDQQEMSDVVEQLREELRLSKAQNERLKEMIVAKDAEEVARKYAELSENFQKLKRTLAVSQAMADAYCKESDRLKKENSELREQISAPSCKEKLPELGEEKKRIGETTAVSSKEVARLKVQLGETLEKLKSAEVDCDALRLQCESHAETLLEKERQLLKSEGLRKHCEELEGDRDMLRKQVALYREDFHTEQKVYEDKLKELEVSIAKHQDWIRRLVQESQKCRSLYEEEKTKREMAERGYHDLQLRFHSHIMQSRSVSSSCGMLENRIHKPPMQDLQVDNAPESASLPAHLQLSQDFPQGNSRGAVQEVDEIQICPRCEREFEGKDYEKWIEHCARCTDD